MFETNKGDFIHLNQLTQRHHRAGRHALLPPHASRLHTHVNLVVFVWHVLETVTLGCTRVPHHAVRSERSSVHRFLDRHLDVTVLHRDIHLGPILSLAHTGFVTLWYLVSNSPVKRITSFTSSKASIQPFPLTDSD